MQFYNHWHNIHILVLIKNISYKWHRKLYILSVTQSSVFLSSLSELI